MLQKLHIKNFAIIDDLSINFSKHLSIITGETGAGKSILMDALNLILGSRAESNSVMNKEKKCIVEGYFDTRQIKEVGVFLNANDLDGEEEIVLRREIAVNGKSRAFINDTPVNLNQLKEIGVLLVDLHQQFDTLELGENDFQRSVLDAMADNVELINEYGFSFEKFIQSKKDLEALHLQQQTASATMDYNRFLYEELNEASLKENELEDLDAELKLLSNAENIKVQLSAIYFELSENDTPIVQHLKSLCNKLHSLEQYHPQIEQLNKRLLSTQLELVDIADEIDSLNAQVNYNPERLQQVNEKIALGYKLFKKHNVSTTAALISLRNELQIKLASILNIDAAILAKEQETNQLKMVCEKQAAQISLNRQNAIKSFTEKVNSLLKQVGMPNACIKIQLEKTALYQYGAETVSFLFDANKSNNFQPLRKVASGGELSRLMLCIKSLVAQKLKLPTLIFDEIDTGISGEAAKQVGNIMKSLSGSHQLIAITHQPQIAAKADAHYFVHKTIKEDKVSTSVRQLTIDERVTTIAQMLSGESPTAAALENAREMLEN